MADAIALEGGYTLSLVIGPWKMTMAIVENGDALDAPDKGACGNGRGSGLHAPELTLVGDLSPMALGNHGTDPITPDALGGAFRSMPLLLMVSRCYA